MDDSPVIGSRQPLENLLDPNYSYGLFDKFDMYREVFTNMMKDAIAFAYLEHLLRISTGLSLARAKASKIKGDTKVKIMRFLEVRDQILQEAVQSLDSLINQSDLNSVAADMSNINYKLLETRLAREENQYGMGESLPVCYTLLYKGRYYLLYTPNMTYLDGYLPCSGETTIPLLTEQMIKSLSKDLYCKVNTVGTQVERIKKKKKEPEETPSPFNDDITPILFNESKRVGFEDERLDEEIIKEIKEKEEDEEEDKEVESEPEESEKENDSISVETDIPQKMPGERTWERFQKKAYERQKERDQCGPGDCLVF